MATSSAKLEQHGRLTGQTAIERLERVVDPLCRAPRRRNRKAVAHRARAHRANPRTARRGRPSRARVAGVFPHKAAAVIAPLLRRNRRGPSETAARIAPIFPIKPSPRQNGVDSVSGGAAGLEQAHLIQLQTKGVDQSRERGWLLPPTRVVEEEAGERLAPIFQHAHQCPTHEMRRRAIL
jgi:hypothetical protein